MASADGPAHCRIAVGEKTVRLSLGLEEIEVLHQLIVSSFVTDELRVVRNPGMHELVETPLLVLLPL